METLEEKIAALQSRATNFELLVLIVGVLMAFGLSGAWLVGVSGLMWLFGAVTIHLVRGR